MDITKKVIQAYATKAQHLTDLLKKNSFQWTSAAQKAFQHFKSTIAEAPVLKLPDFSQPFILETDASGVGIGAVLSQNKHPITYFSNKLSFSM